MSGAITVKPVKVSVGSGRCRARHRRGRRKTLIESISLLKGSTSGCTVLVDDIRREQSTAREMSKRWRWMTERLSLTMCHGEQRASEPSTDPWTLTDRPETEKAGMVRAPPGRCRCNFVQQEQVAGIPALTEIQCQRPPQSCSLHLSGPRYVESSSTIDNFP